MASSSAFLIGTLRCKDKESAPSPNSHFAFGSMPVSSSSVDRGTPVHSALEQSPCSAWAVACTGSLENIGALLPAHSTQCVRVTIGERDSASTVCTTGDL